MIERIPKGTLWHLVELDAEDYKRLYIVGWWTFKILSDYTGHLSRASRNLIDNNYVIPSKIVSRVSISEFDHHRTKVNGILAKGTYVDEFKPLLLGRSLVKTPTIIDGCHRSLALYAACFIRGEHQYSPIQAYLGIIGKKRCGIAIQPDTRLRMKNRKIQLEIYGSKKGIRIAKQMLKLKIEGQSMFLTSHGFPSLGTRYNDEVEAVPEDDQVTARANLLAIEEMYDRIYFQGFNSLIPKSFRPEKSTEAPPNGGVNNPFELASRISIGQVYWALMSASLEPYLGFLHTPKPGWPGIMNIMSLMRDFSEIYKPVYDDFTIDFLRHIDEVTHIEVGGRTGVSDVRKVYMSDQDYGSFSAHLAGLHGMRRPSMLGSLQPYLEASSAPVVMRNNLGVQLKREARLFSKYMRGESKNWAPGFIHIKK